jgi:hypothetical protein
VKNTTAQMCSTLMCSSFIWTSGRAITTRAARASQSVQVGTLTASPLILAGAVVDGWAVVIVAPRRAIAVAVAVNRTLVMGTEYVVAQIVMSLRSTRTDYPVPATKIAFIMKGICKRRLCPIADLSRGAADFRLVP